MPVKRKAAKVAQTVVSAKRTKPNAAAAAPAAADPASRSGAASARASLAPGARPQRLFELLTAALPDCSYDVVSIIAGYDRECIVFFLDETGVLYVWSVDEMQYTNQRWFENSANGTGAVAINHALHRFLPVPTPPATARGATDCNNRLLFCQLSAQVTPRASLRLYAAAPPSGEAAASDAATGTNHFALHSTGYHLPPGRHSPYHPHNMSEMWGAAVTHDLVPLSRNRVLYSLESDPCRYGVPRRYELRVVDYSDGNEKECCLDPITVRANHTQTFASLSGALRLLNDLQVFLNHAELYKHNYRNNVPADAKAGFAWDEDWWARLHAFVAKKYPQFTELKSWTTDKPREWNRELDFNPQLRLVTSTEANAVMKRVRLDPEGLLPPVAADGFAKRLAPFPLAAGLDDFILLLVEEVGSPRHRFSVFDLNERCDLLRSEPLAVDGHVATLAWFYPGDSGGGGGSAYTNECWLMFTTYDGRFGAVVSHTKVLNHARAAAARIHDWWSGARVVYPINITPAEPLPVHSNPDSPVLVPHTLPHAQSALVWYTNGSGRFVFGTADDELELWTVRVAAPAAFNAAGGGKLEFEFAQQTLGRDTGSGRGKNKPLPIKLISIVDNDRIAVVSLSRIRIWDIATPESVNAEPDADGRVVTWCNTIELMRPASAMRHHVVYLQPLV